MKTIRFLFDENADPLYRHELLPREPDMVAWRVGDISAPPAATLDPEILLWCEAKNFILVTNNRHSMPPHLANHLEQGRDIPGIIVMNDKMTVGETLDELWLIWSEADESKFHDNIICL